MADMDGQSFGGDAGPVSQAPEWPSWRDHEHPRYMPGEILVSFTDSVGAPPADDPRVSRLLESVARLIGVDRLAPVGAPAGRTAPGRGRVPAPVDADDVEPEPEEDDIRVDVDSQVDAGTVTVLSDDVLDDGQRRQRVEAAPQPPLTLNLRLPGGVPPDSTKRDAVRTAVDRINGSLERLRDGGLAVSSAMPNWICGSTDAKIHGGPGTSPDTAPDGAWTFTMPPSGSWPRDLEAAGDQPVGQPVVVAVLDSSPGWESVADAAPRFRSNALLQRLADGAVIDDWDRFTPRSGIPKVGSHATPDHGIFVAGMVNSIAPHARIHLLHVLDGVGFGDTASLLAALDYCLGLARRGQRVVVNLSLYVLIPPDDEVWAYWFADGAARVAPFEPSRQAPLLEIIDEEIEHRITLLLDAGVVVVAAAGNDAFIYDHHPQPRIPADYDTVLCVVATDRNGEIAAYSNAADVPVTGNCVATWGGQGRQETLGTTVGPVTTINVVPAGADPRDGVVGLYTQPSVDTALGPVENVSGWAYWSGTSFATPIISGLVANLLARDPTLTPRGVMRAIAALAMPAGVSPSLGCPYIRVEQRQWP